MRNTLWSTYTADERATLAANQLRDCLNDATDAVSECTAEMVTARSDLAAINASWHLNDGRFLTKDEYLAAREVAKALLDVLRWKLADFKYQVNTIKANRDNNF